MGQHDPLDIQTRERTTEQREQRSQQALKAEADDFVWLMQSKRGRRIVWRLLEQAGVFQLSFDRNAMQMAFAEGRRSYGNQVLAQVHELCPDQYVAMAMEQKNGE